MISVIILSYNTRDVTLKCLDHLSKSQGIELETIVIDNSSSDGSPEAIAKAFPKVKLIKNKDNVGFAQGNNQGMQLAKGDQILLLNSDCFVEPTTFKVLLSELTTHNWDMAGCKLLNADGTTQPSWGYFPTLRRVIQWMLFVDNLPGVRKFIDAIHVRDVSRYNYSQSVDWVMGALVLLKRDVFTKTRGFDPKYFMYGEEIEWMLRVKKANFKIGFTPATYATHLLGFSTNSLAKMFLSEMKGLIYWYSKHNSKLEQILLKLILIKGCFIRIPAWAFWQRWDLVKAYLQVLPKLLA